MISLQRVVERGIFQSCPKSIRLRCFARVGALTSRLRPSNQCHDLSGAVAMDGRRESDA